MKRINDWIIVKLIVYSLKLVIIIEFVQVILFLNEKKLKYSDNSCWINCNVWYFNLSHSCLNVKKQKVFVCDNSNELIL